MIVITGGGTGGHLRVAQALAAELAGRGQQLIFIGSDGGADRRWFEGSELFEACEFLPSRGVVNKRGLAKIRSLAVILKCAWRVRGLLKSRGVRAVVSVGGYSAAPASFAALLAGVPLFLHEQNARTGRLNAILKPFSRGFFSSYGGDLGAVTGAAAAGNGAASAGGDANSNLAHSGENFVGAASGAAAAGANNSAPNAQNLRNSTAARAYAYPVQERFFAAARVREALRCVLFLGGSQGAVAINDLALRLAKDLLLRGVRVVCQCGAKDAQRVRVGLDATLAAMTADEIAAALAKFAQNGADLTGADLNNVSANSNLGENSAQKSAPNSNLDENFGENSAEFNGKNGKNGEKITAQNAANPHPLAQFVECFDFTDAICEKMRAADVAVSRSGASTTWELVACALPSIFVPYPSAAGNHQFYNAKFLQDAGLCEIIEQRELTGADVLGRLAGMDLRRISEGLIGIKNPNGCREIVDEILARI